MARSATVIAALGALALVGVGAALFLVLGGGGAGEAPPERTPPTTTPDADVEAPATESAGGTRRRVQQQGTCVLFGELHLAEGDAPAPGREVVLRDASYDELTTLTSDTGAFRFEKLAPGGPYELRVAAAGFAEVRLPGIALDRGEERDVGTLVLAPAVPVEVHVRNCTDTPLADAEVRAYANAASARGFDWSKALAQLAQAPVAVASARTDASGVAHFPGLATGSWSFAATKDGYAKGGRSGVALRTGGDAEPIVVYLTRGHRLTGRVLDQDGAPLAGALLLGSTDANPYDMGAAALRARATSAADGTYALSELPPGDVALWGARAGEVPAPILMVRIPDVPAIDITLAEGGMLQGRVTAGATGEPVAGATVRAWAGSRVTSTESDAEGRYALRLGAPGMVQNVQVEKEGWYDTADPQRRAGLEVGRGETATRDFELAQAGAVTGIVTGPSGPVSGATVMVMRMTPGRGFEQRQATTDAAGRYRVAGLRDGTAYALAWGKGVYTSGVPSNPWMELQSGSLPEHLAVEIAATGETEHDIAVVAGASIAGRVETASGEPVGGATVRAWSAGGWLASPIDDVVSAPDGTFRIEGVTPTPQLGIAAAKAGYVSLAGEPLQITADAPPTDVVVRITPAPVVRGRVTLDGGAPPEDTQVIVGVAPVQGATGQMLVDMRAAAASALRHPVRADGTYEVVLAAAVGRLVVRADAPGHATAQSDAVTLAAETAEYTVDVALAPATSIAGRVVDADTREGLAAARIQVQPRRREPRGGDDAMQLLGAVQSRTGRGAGRSVVAVTDASGGFRVGGLAEGDYTLSVECERHVAASKDAHAPGAGDIEIPLAPELEIRGVVVYPDGSPVAGVQVGAAGQDTAGEGKRARGGASTTAGEDGSFVLRGLPAGSYTMSVSNAWQGRANVLPYDGPAVAAGTTDVRLVVREGLRITGRVVDDAGKPVAGAWLWAMPTKPQAGRPASNAQAQTDADGAFELLGLAPDSGPLRVQVNANNGYGGRSFSPRVLDEVAPGTTGLEIALSSGLSVEGVVVDEQGQPLGNAWIQLNPERNGNEGPRNSGSGMIGDGGRFKVGGLDPGTYRVQIQTWGGGRQQQLVITGDGTVTAGATGLRLTASRGAVVSGVVVDGSGQPVVGASVTASAANRRSANANTGADGTFELTGLETDGVYTVTATHAGHIQSSAAEVRPGGASLRLVLANGVECSGRVLDTDGSALGGARLWFRPKDGSNGAQSQSGETEADGSFRLGGFVEGVEYEVQVRVRTASDRRNLSAGVIVGGRGGVTLQAEER